jgi:hypothetical protein
MNEITIKSITIYLLGFGLPILIFAWMRSPFSIQLSYIAFSVLLIGLLCAIVAFYRRSAKLRLIAAHLAVISMFYIWMLRMWDGAVGLSWSFVLISLAGVIYTALLPELNRKLSDVIYREQMAPTTKIGRWIYRILLAVGPVAGVVGALIGLHSGNIIQNKTFLIIFAFLSYLLALLMAFLVTYSYSHGNMEWKTRKNSKE